MFGVWQSIAKRQVEDMDTHNNRLGFLLLGGLLIIVGLPVAFVSAMAIFILGIAAGGGLVMMGIGSIIYAELVAKQADRRKRGQCPSCGHPAGASAMCTECGKQLPKGVRAAT